MAEPLVSVLVPTCNRAAILRRTVEMLCRQTWRPLELVIVNDGSQDDTEATLAALEPAVREARVGAAFVNKPNGGVSSARNEAMRRASGDYFAFLDDDDAWREDKLSLQMAEIRRTGDGACCCYLTKVAPGGESRFPSDKKTLLEGDCAAAYIGGRSYAHICSLVVRAEVAREVGEFDGSVNYAGEDDEWIGRLVHRARFCAVPEELGRYEFTPTSASRVHEGDMLLQRDDRWEQVLTLWKERNHACPSWDEEIWRRRVARDYDQIVKHRLYAGRREEARQRFERAVQMAGMIPPLPKTRRKLRKAWWLSLLGLRLKHPKFASFREIRG